MEMKKRVRQAELRGQTLVSLCAAAAGDAEPFYTAGDVNGSGWQLEVMAALAKPLHQIRGVLVLGPSRSGKSHVGHQLYTALPAGAVVKVQEAEQADIYTFGTKINTHKIEPKNTVKRIYRFFGCSRGGCCPPPPDPRASISTYTAIPIYT